MDKLKTLPRINFQSLKRIKAGHAIMAASVLTVLPIIIASMFSVYSMNKIGLANDRVEVGRQTIEHLLTIGKNLESYRYGGVKLLDTKDPAYGEEMKDIVKENGTHLQAVSAVVEAGTLNIDKKYVEGLKKGRAAVIKATDDFVKGYNGKDAVSLYEASDNLVKPGGKTTSALKELTVAAEKAMDTSRKEQARTQNIAYIFTAAMLLMTFVLIALAVYVINANILKALKESFNSVYESSERLSSSSHKLTENSDGISKAASQIAAAVSQMASGANEQANSASQTATLTDSIAAAISRVSEGACFQHDSVTQAESQLGNLSAAIQDVSKSVQTVAGVASESSATADHGREAVEATISGMERIMMVSQESASKVQTLGAKSKQIGEIVEVINDIADQTNLLALNAAIEAARAGEHGKGFAVVADEVRKLAERSSRATREIADLIKGIQNETMDAVAAMEKGTQEVQTGAQLAQNAGTAIEGMMSAIQSVFSQIEKVAGAIDSMSSAAIGMEEIMEDIAKITDENTSATDEASSSIESVVKAVASIAATSEEAAASSQEVAASAQEQSASVEEITASAQELSAMAVDLDALVQKLNL